MHDERTGFVEGAGRAELLRYLRHEMGHVVNYGYRLFEQEEWVQLFGSMDTPYQEEYRPQPFSRQFVQHLPGWYAQKHPDEDFAETFAVWLDPASNWREAYAGWGCYSKLLYVEKIVKQLGRVPPSITPEGFTPGRELGTSLAEHYRRFGHHPVEVPAYFDGDLKDLFERGPVEGEGFEPADRFLARHRRSLVGNIAYWTGLSESIVRGLIDHFIERSKLLNLWVREEAEPELLLELVAYATTLCMNRLYKGDFVIK